MLLTVLMKIKHILIETRRGHKFMDEVVAASNQCMEQMPRSSNLMVIPAGRGTHWGSANKNTMS